jgi:hypothetical protein
MILLHLGNGKGSDTSQKFKSEINSWTVPFAILSYLSLKQFYELLLFGLPLSNLRQWHNFHQRERSVFCYRVSLDYHSVAFSHLQICRTTQNLFSGRKHSLSCDEAHSDSLLLAEISPPRRPQTWNNFQLHRRFCSPVKSRHGVPLYASYTRCNTGHT